MNPSTAVAPEVTARLETFFRSLYRIRRVEEEVAKVYPTDVIQSPTHLSIGQETISVGVCEALRPDDVVFGTYRGHALFLAKGGETKVMLAELYGKVTGCARGKGGSMHLIDPEHGLMATSAVVGTTIPEAVGYAMALQYRGSDRIVVSFFGDGAVEEGVFYESINFAMLKQLPVLFVCENNFYAIHSHQRTRQMPADIRQRLRGLDIPYERIEDGDTIRIFEATQRLAAHVRSGRGPAFLECMAWRWREHVGPNEDYHAGYRTTDDARPWIDNDQVPRLGGMLALEVRARIEAEVEQEIQDGFRFAIDSPFPDREELTLHVTKEH